MSARDALRVLAQLGMTVRLRGAGRVVDQQPAPGGAVEQGTESTLWLQRGPGSLGPISPQP